MISDCGCTQPSCVLYIVRIMWRGDTVDVRVADGWGFTFVHVRHEDGSSEAVSERKRRIR